jgi:hypothetical protein
MYFASIEPRWKEKSFCRDGFQNPSLQKIGMTTGTAPPEKTSSFASYCWG